MIPFNRLLWRLLHMALSPATQALLDAAFASRDAATTSDADDQSAAAALLLAQQSKADADAANLAAHKKSADDAHEALAAIASELGFPLPS